MAVVIMLILIISIIGVLIFGGTKQRKREREARKKERQEQKQAKEQLKNKKKKAKKDEYVDIFKEERNDNIQEGKTAIAKNYSESMEELQPKTELDTNTGLEESVKEENNFSQIEQPIKENGELNFESFMDNEEMVDEIEFNEALFGDVEEFNPEKAMNDKKSEDTKKEEPVKEENIGLNDDIFSGIEEFDPEKAMQEQAEKEEKQKLEEQKEIMNYKNENKEDDNNLLDFFYGEDLNNEENK